MLTVSNYKYKNLTTSKVARFISVDPLQFKYPYYTPFQYAGNKPMSFIDLDGAEKYSIGKNYEQNTLTVNLVDFFSPFSVEWDKNLTVKPKIDIRFLLTNPNVFSPLQNMKRKENIIIVSPEIDTSTKAKVIKPLPLGINGNELESDRTPTWTLLEIPIGDVTMGGRRQGGYSDKESLLADIAGGNIPENVNHVDVFFDKKVISKDDFMNSFEPLLMEEFGDKWNEKIKLNFLTEPTKNGLQIEIIYKKEIKNVDDY